MGQTITEKIFSQHVGRDVYAGEIVRSPIDMVIGNDITTPISIHAFEQSGAKRLANPDGFSIVLDHFIPAKDIASANQARISRDFAKKHKLKNFFDEKDMGIEHALLPEKGLVVPGDVIIGADSHTCTGGAIGAFATGMGSTDVAVGMVLGKTWLRVPETLKFVISGSLAPGVYSKDVILHIVGMIGADGATYKAMEFAGETIEKMMVPERMVLSNMAVEAGAKCGLIASDGMTEAFVTEMGRREFFKPLRADADAVYERVYELDAAAIAVTTGTPRK
jgi:3-isopropylmalate/(R)-2-methylmalate dehydratase large subunit